MKQLTKLCTLFVVLILTAVVAVACGGGTESNPSAKPSINTAVSSTPTVSVTPSVSVSVQPTVSTTPTVAPTTEPTAVPTVQPAVAPSVMPSVHPSIDPWLTIFTVNENAITGLTEEGKMLSDLEIPESINGTKSPKLKQAHFLIKII